MLSFGIKKVSIQLQKHIFSSRQYLLNWMKCVMRETADGAYSPIWCHSTRQEEKVIIYVMSNYNSPSWSLMSRRQRESMSPSKSRLMSWNNLFSLSQKTEKTISKAHIWGVLTIGLKWVCWSNDYLMNSALVCHLMCKPTECWNSPFNYW